MAYGSTPRDAQNVPVGCVYVPGVGFVALQGSSSVNTDGNGNQSAAVNVNLSAGTATIGNVELVDAAGSNKASISAGGALKVDNSGQTQPISGTVTANAGTGSFTVAQATGSNLHAVLDAGSAVIGSTTIQAASGTALAADQSNTELRVSNYVKSSTAGDTPLTLGRTTKSASLPVTMASDQDNINIAIAAIASALSQSNQIPVSNAAPQGKLTISGTLSANSDNSLTFSGGATVARRIRIQNESAGAIYWETDATASAGSPSLAAPASNAVSVEWIAVQCTTLHIFIPIGGTTTLNGSGGVKVTAYA